MSEATNTQAVVEKTDAQPAAGTEVTNDARNDGDNLDTLLKDFEEQTKPSTTAEPAKPEPVLSATDPNIQKLVAEEVGKGIATERHKAIVKQQYDKLIDHIREETNLSPRVVKGWLEQLAVERPEISNLYFGAKTDAAREKVMASLVKEFRKEVTVTSIDQNATEDREAVAAAVRGSSTRAPEDKPANYANMNNGEAAADIKKKYGYTPNF